MKVLCKRNSVHVSIGGAMVELARGVSEVPDHIGASLIARGVVFAVPEDGVATDAPETVKQKRTRTKKVTE